HLLILLLMFDDAYAAKAADSNESHLVGLNRSYAEEPTERVHVAELKWHSTSTAFIIVFWLFLACIAKLIFNRASSLTRIFPESSLLIAVGLAIGVLLEKTQVNKSIFTLDSHFFFLYLLPPIIFDAGYFMPNRALFKNWDSILLFSVVGTMFNALAIGFSLYLLSGVITFSHTFNMFEILQFSSLISAVDPVAVIAVFEEIRVNDFIFVNVFGEALFNDGITVVIYELFKQFSCIEEVKAIDFIAGAASFFVVSVGGLVVGILAAFLTAVFTKYSGHALILGPCFILLVPYMGYLAAETLSLSPIIAIAICGMSMKQYIKGNVSASAATSVKYFTKMLSSSSETVIFLFLGLSVVAKSVAIEWDLAFIGFTILLCIVIRTIGVIIQCAFLNRFRGKTFSMVDQFILCYGGLRGTIAFGLASSISSSVPAKDMFLTTTIAVIFFTVFLQGSTIRPLVNYLNVELKKSEEPTMAETVYNKYLDYIISGVEDIAGQKGHASLVHDFERLNNNFLCPILMKDHAKTRDFDATKIIRAYAKHTLRDAMSATKWYPQHKRVVAIQ
ncbi:hypothetical protein PENTCL1PPCAC_16190, partial [Pristionchus entomophagus]